MNADYQYLKYCAARSVIPKQHIKTPSGKRTWGQWFKHKFGEDVNEYRQNLIREVEEATTGF